MKYLLFMLALFAASPLLAQPGKSTRPKAAIGGSYQEISWDELVPKGWDPAKKFRNMDFNKMKDGDARAMEVLDMIKQEWDNAPIDPSLDGRRVKIPGFVVPIEEKGRAITEFLLVPYFGACIHVPPPPANQIIHVISEKPITNVRTMDAVWVTGQLKAARYTKETPMGMGAAGYQIKSTTVTAYKEPAMMTITPSR